MKRWFVWYITHDGTKDKYSGTPWYYAREKRQLPKIPYRGWWWFKNKDEAEKLASLMRKDSFRYSKIWITCHNT